jgi:predicted dehydrogenase
MSTIQIGVIGLGVGEQHIYGFQSHADAVVVALADIDPLKRAMAHDKFPTMRIYDCAEALIDDPDVDVVSIASFDDVHFDQVKRAITAGKHVFVEKPLCMRDEELTELDALRARHPNVRLSSNLILRRTPRFQELKRRIESGEMGRLFLLEGDYNYGRIQKIVDGWRGGLPFYSVVHGGAIHVIDLLMWLAGERIVEVQAISNRIASEGTGFRFDDLVLALVRFEGGAVGKITANFGCVYPHFHRVLLYGTEATFENRQEGGMIWHSRDPSQAPEILTSPYPGAAKGDLIPSFVDDILGTGSAEVSSDDVFAAMAVSLAIERAAKVGGPVRVDYGTFQKEDIREAL